MMCVNLKFVAFVFFTAKKIYLSNRKLGFFFVTQSDNKKMNKTPKIKEFASHADSSYIILLKLFSINERLWEKL